MSDREAMARLARGVVGLSAGGANRQAFLDLVAPGETPAVQAELATLSTCGLTVRGLWGQFGMRDARLEAPYVPGSVITNLQAMAKEAGGWGTDPSSIGVGDMIYVSAPDHVGTIVEAVPDGSGGILVTTVDGGSPDAAGFQSVVSYQRKIGSDGSILSGPLSGNGRKLLGFASLPAVAAAFGGGSGGGPDVEGALGGVATFGVLAAAGLLVWRVWRGRW